MVKIYTKTGDAGNTSLFGGKRVSKADLRVEAYGEMDELNSLVGVIIFRYQKSKIKNQKYISKIKNELLEIQKDLLMIGSLLANPLDCHPELVSGSQGMLKQVQHDNDNYLENKIKEFENLIDGMSEELPELRNFILPGGGELGSLLHFARSVCRRTERSIAALLRKENVDSGILMYFNRLSDLLFVMARFVNYKEKVKENIWKRY